MTSEVILKVIFNVFYVILSICWIAISVKESKIIKSKTDVDDDYKKKHLKTRKVMIVLWSIALVLSLVNIVLELTGWGDVPIFK